MQFRLLQLALGQLRVPGKHHLSAALPRARGITLQPYINPQITHCTTASPIPALTSPLPSTVSPLPAQNLGCSTS